MRRVVVRMLLCVFAVGVSCAADLAVACPMCSQSIAKEDAIPRAYMFSILFMLSMPALVLSGLAFIIVRAVRKHNAAQQAWLAEHPEYAALLPHDMVNA